MFNGIFQDRQHDSFIAFAEGLLVNRFYEADVGSVQSNPTAGYQSLLVDEFSRHLLNPFSVKLSRRSFSQMLCDFSFKATTFSKPSDPGRNDLDEQKTGEDGENNKQIEIFFRHCPAFRQEDRAMPRPLRNG